MHYPERRLQPSLIIIDDGCNRTYHRSIWRVPVHLTPRAIKDLSYWRRCGIHRHATYDHDKQEHYQCTISVRPYRIYTAVTTCPMTDQLMRSTRYITTMMLLVLFWCTFPERCGMAFDQILLSINYCRDIHTYIHRYTRTYTDSNHGRCLELSPLRPICSYLRRTINTEPPRVLCHLLEISIFHWNV